ncbi:MAG: hypothetical protein RIS47_1237 [Bacteroidota bacterium]|jgi:hypothetical protein
MKRFTLYLLASLLATSLQAQVANLSMNPIIEAQYLDTLYLKTNTHSSIRPFLVKDIGGYNTLKYFMPLITDSRSWNKFLNAQFFPFNIQGYKLQINPIFTTEIGPVYTLAVDYEKDRKLKVQDLQLGFEAKANINPNLAFCFDFIFQNWTSPEYQRPRIDSTHVIPQTGIYKNGDSFGYAAYYWQGHLSYSPLPYLNFQIGKEKHFLGDGYRSLFYSDNAPSQPYISATVEVGKIKYQFMVSQNTGYNGAVPSERFSTKYITTHYLSYNATKWLNLNFFETVIQQATDTVGHRGYEINYLNPALFLRPIEFNIGSPDNALLGMGYKINLSPHYQIYGQFLLDELIVSNLLSNNGWWGNKYAIQFGLKTVEPFKIKGLQVRLEGNMAQPYTYSHGIMSENLSNLYQPIAHPLGANFVELLSTARLQRGRIGISYMASYAQKGLDTPGKNYGGDIFKNYETRTVPDETRYVPEHWEGTEDFGHHLLQGLRTTYIYTEGRFYLIINPKLRLIGEIGLRSIRSKNIETSTNYTYGFIGIRTLLNRPTDDH